jgi:hypothetical protein
MNTLREAAEAVLQEWHFEAKSRPYTLDEIRSWLHNFMGPRMDDLLAALSAPPDAKEGQGNGWTKMPRLPEPNTLVWCRRSHESGRIYLARRNGQPLATDPDLSRDCHWYGAPEDELRDKPFKELRFRYNFADGSVSEWCYAAPSPSAEPTVGESEQGEADEALVAIEKAREEVSALCNGKRWTMSIPAREGEDSDLVIADALRKARSALLASRPSEITANARDKAEAFAVQHNLDAYLIPPLAELLDDKSASPKDEPLIDLRSYWKGWNDCKATASKELATPLQEARDRGER